MKFQYAYLCSGDEVLKKAAGLIRSFSEAVDFAARWGGEELALYAPNISVHQGVQIAGLILRNVKEKTTPSTTLSSGVSSWDHTIV
ncbi:diguanylate cyclase domain-containing protein [Virgibacillus oceani]